jgi:AraC-like DNA-binding protein
MLEKIYIDEPNNTDLNMYRCGMEDCKPDHSWGPAIRDHYIIHYILEGRGIFQVNGVTFHLEEHDGFLICPDTIVYYRADQENPWSYAWAGFNGLKAEAYLKQAGLSSDKPVFSRYNDKFLIKCFNRMIDTKSLDRGREVRLLGLLYQLLSQLIELAPFDKSAGKNEDRKESYVKKAVEFIGMNYSRKITVAEIAQHVGLDRSYFYSIFRSYLNISPQEFLIGFRLDKSCELMKNTSLSIGDISRSVGYQDPLLFSKVFKKNKGLPPRDYRKIMIKGW